MAVLAPPPPSRVTHGDDGSIRRVRLRVFQVGSTLTTILATIWLCTLGVIPGILGVMVAKHILVAILIMGLGTDTEPSGQA